MDLKDKPAIILFEDGTNYQGYALGVQGTTTGELCFNTGMTGYQEIFTDPSYYGQLLVATHVHIGNYGISKADQESDKIQIAGLICKNYNVKYSRHLADETIQEYFEREGLVGICGVDTRAIVRHIRSKGAMNAIISSTEFDIKVLKKELERVPSMKGLELASKVTTDKPYQLGSKDSRYKVAVLDYGVKRNILECLVRRNCLVKVFPAKTGLDELEAWKPDGYFLSNGPGDPSAMSYAIECVKKILAQKKPLFGICLGHQLLASAVGIKTYKMHHGHRGINHPVKNLITGKSEITSQNHGFGVDADSIQKAKDIIQITHVNLNDQTIEGIRVKDKPAFSIQYHPEASPGPHDARYLFDDFIKEMENNK